MIREKTGHRPFDGEAIWIWVSDTPRRGRKDRIADIARFRYSFHLARVPQKTEVCVSADSRYIFYCNGREVGRGPAKGDIQHHYYETYDLRPWLRRGKNVLAAEVISFYGASCDYFRGGPPASVMTAGRGFILHGWLRDRRGQALSVRTSRAWRACGVSSVELRACPGVPLAGGGEECRFTKEESEWFWTDYDDSGWGEADEITPGIRPDNVGDSMWPHRLVPREIPALAESKRAFRDLGDSSSLRKAEMGKVLAGKWVMIPARARADFLLDAGELVTAYPCLTLAGGVGSIISLFYGERLLPPQRIARADGGGTDNAVRDMRISHAPLTGPLMDRICCAGGNGIWRPRFWRAFRFLRIVVKTAGKALRLRVPGFIHTAYPYPRWADFACDQAAYRRIWQIGLHTLECCSHETFEDCPYYEQLQYAGDVQTEAEVAYYCTGDTALARQAIRHFAWSLLAEGITQSRYPSRVPQVIPLWSLHWVQSVWDYYLYTGDLSLPREVARQMAAVLDWFLQRIGSDGLLGKMPYWQIADWSPDWRSGEPPGMSAGKSALPNFMLVNTLVKASRLFRAAGIAGWAADWASAAQRIRQAAHACFWSEKAGLYRDTPGEERYSQLANAWAILSQAASGASARRIGELIVSKQGLARAAFFGRYFVFHALLQAGLRQRAWEILTPWREMLARGFTTWPEEPSFGRSDCHAWSCLPNVALQRLILGVRALTPGCRRLLIQPYLADLRWARGEVCLPQGRLRVSAEEIARRRIALRLHIPAGVEADIRVGNVRRRAGRGRHFLVFGCNYSG